MTQKRRTPRVSTLSLPVVRFNFQSPAIPCSTARCVMVQPAAPTPADVASYYFTSPPSSPRSLPKKGASPTPADVASYYFSTPPSSPRSLPKKGAAPTPADVASYYFTSPPSSPRAGCGKAMQNVKKRKPRRRAVVIGINYTSDPSFKPLKGCIEDTEALLVLLAARGFTDNDIILLTDIDARPENDNLPTRKNILDACDWLVEDAQPGDFLFFSFSGHGAQELDPHGYEEDGMNETLLPLDCYDATSGVITDDVLSEHLVEPLPSGCKLVALVDACHSGTVLDLPFTWKRNGWREDANPLFSAGDVVLISGCKDKEIASDGAEGGLLTRSFVEVLARNPFGVACVELHKEINKYMRRKGKTQRPKLTSSQAFCPSRLFTLDNSDIQPNMNTKMGRQFRRKFKPICPWKERCAAFLCWFPLGVIAGGSWSLTILTAMKRVHPSLTKHRVLISVSVAVVCGFVLWGCCFRDTRGAALLRMNGLRFCDFFAGACKKRKTAQKTTMPPGAHDSPASQRQSCTVE